MWTRATNDAARRAARQCARGIYQDAIVDGNEALSGSTLGGKARGFASRYYRSRLALLARITHVHIPWRVDRGQHGRWTFVLGECHRGHSGARGACDCPETKPDERLCTEVAG